MLGQVVDTVVRFFSKLHCNIKCCSNTVRVSSPVRGGSARGGSPCIPGAGDAGPLKRRPYKPRSPVRRQRTI